jgi:hypothetical protein
MQMDKAPDKLYLPGHPKYNPVTEQDKSIAFHYEERVDFITRKKAIDIINQLSGILLVDGDRAGHGESQKKYT